MTDKKITDEEIKSSLEVIATTRNCNECKIRNCKWGTCNCSQITANAALDLVNRQQAEIERLKAFKSYFDELYGQGLDIANWHLDGDLEPFDNFFEAALQEMVGEDNAE